MVMNHDLYRIAIGGSYLLKCNIGSDKLEVSRTKNIYGLYDSFKLILNPKGFKICIADRNRGLSYHGKISDHGFLEPELFQTSAAC